jgi:hypothetical protein
MLGLLKLLVTGFARPQQEPFEAHLIFVQNRPEQLQELLVNEEKEPDPDLLRLYVRLVLNAKPIFNPPAPLVGRYYVVQVYLPLVRDEWPIEALPVARVDHIFQERDGGLALDNRAILVEFELVVGCLPLALGHLLELRRDLLVLRDENQMGVAGVGGGEDELSAVELPVEEDELDLAGREADHEDAENHAFGHVVTQVDGD